MRKRTIVIALGAIAALVIGFQVVALANHVPEHFLIQLEGSNFEIDGANPTSVTIDNPTPPPDLITLLNQGANLKVDHDGTVPPDDPNTPEDESLPAQEDWASIDPAAEADLGEVRQPDKDSGAQDDSFGQGAKEDTLNPTVVDGSIPPNKSDLLNFGVYLEQNTDGKFLNLFWHRVQEPSGTTNMDFEFNKNTCGPDVDDVDNDDNTTEPNPLTCTSNGITPVRQAGDILIQYDLSQGGTNPQLFVSKWVATGNKSLCEAANSTPCWGDRIQLTNADTDGDGNPDAVGSINNLAIPGEESDGLAPDDGEVSPRTFGEAQIDFDALSSGAGSGCTAFGSAFLKSRSSDSFTAAMKDFIAPTPLGLDTCAQVTIRKQTLPDEDPNTTDFTYTHNLVADPPIGSTSFTLKDDGVFTNSNVVQNTQAVPTYTVTETAPAASTGYTLTAIDCSASDLDGAGAEPTKNVAAGTVTFTINSPDDVVDCTYFNTLKRSTLSTVQSFTPQDTATISGTNLLFDGAVTFKLRQGAISGTTETCANTTDTVVYEQTVANANLVTPDPPTTPASRTASTSNDGSSTDGDAGYSILAADAGAFFWQVTYGGATDPTVTSCNEVSTVSINNGTAVSNP